MDIDLEAAANEAAWIADHPGAEVRAMLERRRAADRDMEARIVWPTGDGCNDTAGSEVAQVRSGLDQPGQSQTNPAV